MRLCLKKSRHWYRCVQTKPRHYVTSKTLYIRYCLPFMFGISMFLSSLSFCFSSLLSQIGRYSMLFNCISSNLWISYSFSVDQNKTPPQSFHISCTLFYVCYLKTKCFFPSLPYGSNNIQRVRGFQERRYLKAVPESSTEICFSKLHPELQNSHMLYLTTEAPVSQSLHLVHTCK